MSTWSKKFTTNCPETGKPTQAKTKTDETGAVTEFIYGIENDKEDGRKHGHVWELGPYSRTKDIDGRKVK